MSKETVQFVEIAREHVANMTFTTWRWCPVCQVRTDHTSEVDGRREVITCTACGNTLFDGPTR